MKKTLIIMATLVGGLISSLNYASANSYEIRSNIFNGGYTVYSGGSAVSDVTPNIFTGGWTVRSR